MDTRSIVFLVIMIALGAAALLAFIVFLIVNLQRRARDAEAQAPAAGPEAAPAQVVPPAVRLLGLLALLIAFLILDWTFLDGATAYALMAYLVYPAALATALVLLFDKATRSWSYKGAMAGVREWLFCDTIVFLLVLAYLNLWMSGVGEAYGSLFWDLLGLLLTFLVFWLLDRKVTRYRFLVAYGYLALLPILLLMWAAVQDVPAGLRIDQRPRPAVEELASTPQPAAPEDEETFAPKATEQSAGSQPANEEEQGAPAEESAPEEAAVVEAPEPDSWWKTIWPFFAWAAAFFVLEIIGLIAIEDSDRSLVLLLKDVAFVVGYVGLLLVAAI